MDFSLEWTVICRICLQEGVMKSIYDKDDSNVMLSEKIMLCSAIVIRGGMNLPEQICQKCLHDLDVAYRFRMNCESSDAILQSFGDVSQIIPSPDVVLASETGELYCFKPPSGLHVKKVRASDIERQNTVIKPDPDSQISQNYYEMDDPKNDDSNENDDDDMGDETFEADYLDEPETIGVIEETESNIIFGRIKKEEIEDLNTEMDNIEPIDCEEGILKEIIIKPVTKSRNRRAKVNQPEAVTDPSSNPNESGGEVFRVRRKLNVPKALKICEICGNTYKYKHALESHMRRHRNEKPFACEICGRAFVIAFELRRHMRTHTGQKPYACKHCDRRFSDFGSRIKHERTHTGERPYECKTCGKRFAYSHVLSSHNLTHTGEKKYCCDVCQKRFTKAHHLKAHLNIHVKALNMANQIIHKTKNPTASIRQTTTSSDKDVEYDDVVIMAMESFKEAEEEVETLILD